MKRFAIIALLILAAGAFIVVPMLKGNDTDVDTAELATFNFDGFLATPYGKDTPIAFTVPEGPITKVELIYNDSLFAQWKNPKGKITLLLDADFYGVGSRSLVLRSTFSDGTTEEDPRMIRVLSDIHPKPLIASVAKAYPHDATSYTQGLEFDKGQLYEGSGNPGNTGESKVGKVDLNTGQFTLKNALDATYFGEGITIFGDELFQLTWQNGKCFVWDKNTMQLKREYMYTGQGWGLCNDGHFLIMSDGSERITFRDPKTFRPVRTIEVYDDQGPRPNLNELEYVNGKIYANVYMTNLVLTIDPLSGKVLEEIDASALALTGKMGGEVLNGIAYNPLTKKLYMTGKYWGKILEVSISE